MPHVLSSWSTSNPDPGRALISHKRFVITGGTDGVGLAIATGLASEGHHVVIVGRVVEKGRVVANRLRTLPAHPTVEFIAADLSIVSEVDSLSADLLSRGGRLDGLVLNAGVVVGKRQLTREGLELMFATNFLGRFVLAQAMLPSLIVNAQAQRRTRLLLISGASLSWKVRYDDPNFTRDFGLIAAVQQFCAANDLLALALADTIGRTDGTLRSMVKCLKLGIVRSAIVREHFPAWLRVVRAVMRPLYSLSAEEAGQAALQLLAADDSNSVLYTMLRRVKSTPLPADTPPPAERARFMAWAAEIAAAARAGSTHD